MDIEIERDLDTIFTSWIYEWMIAELYIQSQQFKNFGHFPMRRLCNPYLGHCKTKYKMMCKNLDNGTS